MDEEENEIVDEGVELDGVCRVDVERGGLFDRWGEVLKGDVDSKVEKWKEDRLKWLDEELGCKKEGERVKSECGKKEYDGKGSGYLDGGGGLECMWDRELRDGSCEMVEEGYSKGEVSNIKCCIDGVVGGGMEVSCGMKEV